MLQTPHGAFSF